MYCNICDTMHVIPYEHMCGLTSAYGTVDLSVLVVGMLSSSLHAEVNSQSRPQRKHWVH